MAIFDQPSDATECNAEALVALVKSGDRAALDRITRCYGARLVAVGRRQCRDQQGADDAVQDALLSAAEHLGDFRGEGSIEGWLMRMVTNACHRMRRGQKNDPALHKAFEDREHSDAPSPSQSIEQSHLAEVLDTALGTLSPEDRALVLLADVNGWRGPELAEAMAMSPGQVRTRLSRARRHLREELAPIWKDWDTSSRKAPGG